MKNNVGVKQRVASDKYTGATTRGRTSLGPSVLAPPTETNPSPDNTDTAEAAPRTGEKRVRSSSSSSLSTHTPTPTAAGLDQSPAFATQKIGDPPAPSAQESETALEASRASPALAPLTMSYSQALQLMPTATQESEVDPTSTDSDMEQQVSSLADPTTPVTPEHRPLSFPSPHMTPTYRVPLPIGACTPPHQFEPIVHTFHLDTPAFVPNPSQATADTMARLLALRSQRTRRCDPQHALTRTVPTPTHGWPRVYPAAPDFLYTNIPEATLQKWLSEDSKGKKVIVQVMRQNSWCPPQCDTTANLLARTISAIYDSDKVRVATASEDIRGRSQQNPPYSFLVFGLTPMIAQSMVAKHCFATSLIQFLVYPLVYAATPCFIGSLGGLRNIGDDPSDAQNLREDLTMILLHNRRWYQAILAYATDVAAAAGDIIMDPDAATIRVMTKLSLGILNTKSPGGVEEPTVNLYLELPASTDLDQAFPTFIEAAHRVCFDTPLTGTGRFFTGFVCVNCRGITHPTGLCPFENEPDWVAITKPDQDDRTDPPSGAPPPPPPPPPGSPRNQGPTPRRDTPGSTTTLQTPSYRSSRGRGSGRF